MGAIDPFVVTAILVDAKSVRTDRPSGKLGTMIAIWRGRATMGFALSDVL